MNAVGIDVSKGTSTVCVMRPFGEVVASPFEVTHTVSELGKLAGLLKSLNGETKVVMECTGSYCSETKVKPKLSGIKNVFCIEEIRHMIRA